MKKNVLITGATSGIGLEAVRHFSRQGWRVYGTGRNEKKMNLAAQEFSGQDVHFLQLDVDQPESIRIFCNQMNSLTANYGVDVLVNNAGFARAAALAEITDADLRAHFETNVFAVVSITQAFLPQMMKRKAGRIINVSSSGGKMSLPFVGAYHAAKFAVEAISDAFRWELKPLGIFVSVIEPGPVRTPFADILVDSTQTVSSDSPYAECFKDVAKMQKMAERHMMEPEVVVKDILRAATARRPRAHYMQPRILGFVILLTHILPTRLVDAVISRMFSLSKARLK